MAYKIESLEYRGRVRDTLNHFCECQIAIVFIKFPLTIDCVVEMQFSHVGLKI